LSSSPTPPCPTDETLAAFADGTLDAGTRATVLAHIETCPDCMAAVLSATAHLEEEASRTDGTYGTYGTDATHPPHESHRSHRSHQSYWWAAAAAVLIALLAVPLLLREDEPVARLVALAPRSARMVEPRLTGGFAWAEYAGAERAGTAGVDAEQMKLAGAAGELVERAGRDRGAEAQHAAGVAMVLVQKPADAIPRLEAAAEQSGQARNWSDLAAARYAAASQLGRASLYPLALAAADRALRIDPRLPEALFNRALILERIGLMDEARRAWERYLEHDPSSAWANEARARLADLPSSPRSSQFERDRPLLERAAARGDTAAVRRYVDAHRGRARRYAEAEYLGRWGEAVQRRDDAAAAQWLSVARGIGDALAALSGETLARDAVHTIDRASPADRQDIAAAHVLYRRARIAYSRNERDAAERELLQAAAAFEAVHHPLAMVARYYAASARLARSDTAGARLDLERARSAADAHPSYFSLGAHVRWELGRAYLLDSDWAGAVPVLRESAELFRRSGERAGEAFVEMLHARALGSLGRADDAWLARTRVFAALSAEGEAELLATSLDSTLRAELLAGHADAALSLSALELSAARAGTRPQLVLEALVNRALLEAEAGQVSAAMDAAREAEGLAKNAADPALRARHLADVALAMGAAQAERDPRAAAASLTRAIDFYTAHALPVALPQPLLLRARCAARTGDVAAALRDLERGMTVVEKHRRPELLGAPASPGTPRSSEDPEKLLPAVGILDAEHELYADAIRLSLDRGDTAAAFAFSERSRGATVTLAELQRRLAGSGMAVLEIVALPRELVTFAVTEDAAVVARRARASGTHAALAEESLTERGTAAAEALYDDVVRPVEPLLARVRELAIIPDPRLESAPFAALYDRTRRRYLVERFAVSTAASAGSLQRGSERSGVPALVAIALPSGGESAGLPEAEREVRDVAALYAQAQSTAASGATLTVLRDAAAHAGVLHIAGHTERQPGGGEQALLLAGASGSGIERVSWKTILAAPAASDGVVVLAACETLRPPASSATRAPSLGGAFSAAGAGDVIGTLAPVGDRDARMLFRALHRRLAAGVRPAEALRAVQQETIDRERQAGGRRAWRAVALMTRRIPAPPRGKDSISWASTH